MRILKLEYFRLKNTILKSLVIVLVLHAINTMIFIKNIKGLESSEDFFTLLFSSSNGTFISWMYWLSFSVGYIVFLQILWKTPIYMFEMQMILRLRQWRILWIARFIIGIIFTFYYVITALSIAIILFSFLHVSIQFNLGWVFIFIYITINLFLHGTIWLVLKNHLTVEVANICVLGMFFAGIKIENKYIPLYYGMYEHVQGQLLFILLELIIIACLMTYVVYHSNKTDYL
ncbi:MULTISPECIES: hypothetical protein [Bacillus]|uniref:hypothetical protein n=1 Tax=Bacillus TaxID=1386 RepID=UPI001C0B1030|nr:MULTISPECIES: hypothetical protein [Bacillus]MBU4619227.1 hypothetical protein [Bacillus sp. GG161]UOG08838.1 hypothetical protein MTX65_06145 [Bacillus altitudinis]